MREKGVRARRAFSCKQETQNHDREDGADFERGEQDLQPARQTNAEIIDKAHERDGGRANGLRPGEHEL